VRVRGEGEGRRKKEEENFSKKREENARKDLNVNLAISHATVHDDLV
jgi:hypothetical protein